MGARREFLLSEEAQRVQDSLGAFPGSERRCVTAVAKIVLLRGPYFCDGRRINPVGKSLGAGVWAITHKED